MHRGHREEGVKLVIAEAWLRHVVGFWGGGAEPKPEDVFVAAAGTFELPLSQDWHARPRIEPFFGFHVTVSEGESSAPAVTSGWNIIPTVFQPLNC